MRGKRSWLKCGRTTGNGCNRYFGYRRFGRARRRAEETGHCGGRLKRKSIGYPKRLRRMPHVSVSVRYDACEHRKLSFKESKLDSIRFIQGFPAKRNRLECVGIIPTSRFVFTISSLIEASVSPRKFSWQVPGVRCDQVGLVRRTDNRPESFRYRELGRFL